MPKPRIFIAAGLMAASLLASTAVFAATVASLASPGKVLTVSVTLDNDGRPGYQVARHGRSIVAESRLGFVLADAPKLERNFAFSSSQTRSSDEQARELSVSLDFLDANRSYRAQIFRDGADADWQSKPHSIVIENRLVKRGDTLALKLAPGGGAAVRFNAIGRK